MTGCVLISSAGRRVGLVRAFQEAILPLGGRVMATDLHPELSAACQIADMSERVPRVTDDDFLPATLKLAQAAGVGLIVPTLDTELAAFASVRAEWADLGIHVSVPDSELVRVCRDKRLTAGLFEGLGISPLRENWDSFPRFIKPIAGSLSSDIHVVPSAEGLLPHLNNPAAYVHQELVDRSVYAEYSVDAHYSRDGDLVCAVPRRRIEVRGGEISKGRTEKGELLGELSARLSHIPGARGCLTIQVFHAPARRDRPLIGIEVNARFGGGYPMSHAAGARFTDGLVQEAFLGAKLEYRDDWDEDVTFLRFDDHVAVNG